MSFSLKGTDVSTNETAAPSSLRNYVDAPFRDVAQNVSDDDTVGGHLTQATTARIYNDIISSPAVRVTIIVFYFIVILVATLGNILVMLVIYRRRSLRRNPAVLLIFNLAMCDLVSCVVYRPLLLLELFLPFLSLDFFHNQLDECKAASYFQGMLAGRNTTRALLCDLMCTCM